MEVTMGNCDGPGEVAAERLTISKFTDVLYNQL